MIRFLILGSIALVVIAGGLREVLSSLENPAIEELRFPETDTALFLFHQGRMERSAVLFHGIASQPQHAPRPLVRLHYGEIAPEGAVLLGELLWTRDGTSIYATSRDEEPVVLWLLDLHTGQLLAGPTAYGRASPDGLARILATKEGPGVSMAKWYELGTGQMEPLYSWEASHWQRLAKNLPGGG